MICRKQEQVMILFIRTDPQSHSSFSQLFPFVVVYFDLVIIPNPAIKTVIMQANMNSCEKPTHSHNADSVSVVVFVLADNRTLRSAQSPPLC